MRGALAHPYRSAFLAFAVAFAFAPLVVPTPAQSAGGGMGATAPSHGGAIDGIWNSNIGATYEITQHGHKFIWWAGLLDETAMGVVDGNGMRAVWSGRNGDGRGTAVIKDIDGAGHAHRIEWSNGVVFKR